MCRCFSISLLSNICSHFQLAGQFLAHSESIFIQIVMKYIYSLFRVVKSMMLLYARLVSDWT